MHRYFMVLFCNIMFADVKLGRISPDTTRFDVTGGSISTNEF